MSLTMNKQEVLDYLENNDLGVFVSYSEAYDKDGNYVDCYVDDDGNCVEAGPVEKKIDYWGFTSPGGFHTFDMEMDEGKAQYATALFHKLHHEHNVDFGTAERLAGAYVYTYKVMQEPITEEEQQEFRKRAIEALKAGNVVFPDGLSEQENENG